jgi:hypothetical protein
MRLHRYRGKENGLMIMGTASELRTLGEALIAAAGHPPESPIPGWPVQVAGAPITSSQDFLLSFHLEASNASTPQSNFP